MILSTVFLVASGFSDVFSRRCTLRQGPCSVGSMPYISLGETTNKFALYLMHIMVLSSMNIRGFTLIFMMLAGFLSS